MNMNAKRIAHNQYALLLDCKVQFGTAKLETAGGDWIIKWHLPGAPPAKIRVPHLHVGLQAIRGQLEEMEMMRMEAAGDRECSRRDEEAKFQVRTRAEETNPEEFTAGSVMARLLRLRSELL